jgi:MFS family permease
LRGHYQPEHGCCDRFVRKHQTDLQWIVAACILVFAALLLTMGARGDRIGHKRVMKSYCILFTILPQISHFFLISVLVPSYFYI